MFFFQKVPGKYVMPDFKGEKFPKFDWDQFTPGDPLSQTLLIFCTNIWPWYNLLELTKRPKKQPALTF